jgi:cyclophilin family peptidyl-prolyl cis-trans isomerase
MSCYASQFQPNQCRPTTADAARAKGRAPVAAARLSEDSPMKKTSNPRARLAALALALLALALSACSGDGGNKNTAPANRNSAAPNANTAPAPAANANAAPAAANTNTAANANKAAAATGQPHTVLLDTTAGKIKIELLDKDAPVTAENFRKLASSGFYNGLIFHRAIKGFMIQGGDPNGNGTGGRTADGKTLPNEINRSSPLYQGGYARGLVAMANRGAPETATSQFFIMHQTYPLPPNYTVFGRVIEGMDVVDKIATAPNEGGSDRPANPVKMTKVTVQ